VGFSRFSFNKAAVWKLQAVLIG